MPAGTAHGHDGRRALPRRQTSWPPEGGKLGDLALWRIDRLGTPISPYPVRALASGRRCHCTALVGDTAVVDGQALRMADVESVARGQLCGRARNPPAGAGVG